MPAGEGRRVGLDDMKKTHFDFKQFTIYHDKCAMKVGTDGVLLGAWTVPQPGVKCILDVGTGSGLIAIMLAQKCGAALVGIDLDEAAVAQARENAANTPWGDRLHFVQADASTFEPREPFQLIVCNPPFFTESLSCPDSRRDKARHCSALPFDLLLSRAATWLEPEGLFKVVLPAVQADGFIQMAWERGLQLHGKCWVCTKPGSRPKRVLLSFRKGAAPYPRTEWLAIRDQEGRYTEAYMRLTEPYYLNF